jgi:hypothetical protein
MNAQPAKSNAVHRALCRLGWHRWEIDRYWSLGGLFVEGRVCSVCKLTHRERKVVHRP